jgi:hypothetical protein
LRDPHDKGRSASRPRLAQEVGSLADCQHQAVHAVYRGLGVGPGHEDIQQADKVKYFLGSGVAVRK